MRPRDMNDNHVIVTPAVAAGSRSAGVRGGNDSDGDLQLSVGSGQDDSESTALLPTSPPAAAAAASPAAGVGDDVDGSHQQLSEWHRVQEMIQTTQMKIAKCKQAIQQEQRIRDENVDEYLRVTASNVDKHQLQKLKTVFERNNLKSSHHMAHLQLKLQEYIKRQRQLETTGAACRSTKGVLKDVGQGLKNVGGNIRHGITGLSGTVVDNVMEGIQGAADSVMSKPREIAHLLKNRFGSADNIASLSGESSEDTPTRSHHGSATLPAGIPSFPKSVVEHRSDDGSDISSVASEIVPHTTSTTTTSTAAAVGSPRAAAAAAQLNELRQLQALHELGQRQDEVERQLREQLDTIKSTLQLEVQQLQQQLHEQRDRHERVEEQLNDFIELHQNEIENLRQQICDAEEKVQYQSDERLRDVHEVMDKCNTRILRMEQQQLEQHQQLVNIEVIGNSQARALIVKLVNCALTALQLLLLLVNTLVGVSAPFLRTRLRFSVTVCLACVVALVAHHWSIVARLLRWQVAPFLLLPSAPPVAPPPLSVATHADHISDSVDLAGDHASD